MTNIESRVITTSKQKVALLHELVDFIDDRLCEVRALQSQDLRQVPRLIIELTDCRIMLEKLGDIDVGLLAKRLRYFIRDNLPVSGDWLEENTATATIAVSTVEVVTTLTKIIQYLTLVNMKTRSSLITAEMIRNIDSRYTYADSTADISAALKRDVVNKYEAFGIRSSDIEISHPVEKEFATSIRRIYSRTNFTETRKIQFLNSNVYLSFSENSAVFGLIMLRL
nr:25kDa protein [Agapanthus velarivirus]QVY19212.1 25kDa protein [Agapanthus velarivirus]QVY47408.1 25kDa protein [Agapanthus velarivirus]